MTRLRAAMSAQMRAQRWLVPLATLLLATFDTTHSAPAPSPTNGSAAVNLTTLCAVQKSGNSTPAVALRALSSQCGVVSTSELLDGLRRVLVATGVRCAVCGPGTQPRRSNASALACVSCPAGRYQRAASAAPCLPCAVNSQPDSNRSTCVCGAGRFRGGGGTCTLCAAGFAKAAAGDAACARCPAMQDTLANRTRCIDRACRAACPQGSVESRACNASAAVDRACLACGNGTFAAKGARNCTACASCAKGRYASRVCTSSADSLCASCGAGKYLVPKAGACKVCGSCTSSQIQIGACTNVTDVRCRSCGAAQIVSVVNATSTCKSCGQGRVPDAARRKCNACAAGRFSNGTVCRVCSRTWQPNANQTACVRCGKEYFSLARGTACTACRKCNTTLGQVLVQACSATQNSICTSCLAGTFATSTGCAACKTCSPALGQALAAPCLKGSNARCQQCSAGTVLSTNRSACVVCPQGRFSTTGRECVPCATCPDGKRTVTRCSATKNVACQACINGVTFANGTVCAACGKCSRYAKVLLPCSAVRNIVCSTCPKGSFGQLGICVPCKQCVPGKFKVRQCSTSADRICATCDRRKYSADSTNGTCRGCQPGKQPSADQGSCNRCSPGRFSSSATNYQCAACGAGKMSTRDFTSCTACSAGRFSMHGAACVPCSVCPLGAIQLQPCSATSDRECKLCKSGLYADPVKSVCRKCSVCPLGATPVVRCSKRADAVCRLCGNETFGQRGQCHGCARCLPHEHEVSPCAAGKDRTCSSCPAGKRSSLTMRSLCVDCPLGSSMRVAIGECTSCERGRYGLRNWTGANVSACASCPLAALPQMPAVRLNTLGTGSRDASECILRTDCALSNATLCPGEWSASGRSIDKTLMQCRVGRCLGARYSESSEQNSSDVICSSGYRSDRCSECEPRFYMRPEMACHACPGNVVSLISGTVAAVSVLGLLVVSVIKPETGDSPVIPLIRLSILHCQCVGFTRGYALYSAAAGRAIEMAIVIGNPTSVILTGLDCSLDLNRTESSMAQVWLCIGCAFAVFAVGFPIVNLLQKKQTTPASTAGAAISISAMLLILIWPSLFSLYASVVTRRSEDETGTSLLVLVPLGLLLVAWPCAVAGLLRADRGDESEERALIMVYGRRPNCRNTELVALMRKLFYAVLGTATGMSGDGEKSSIAAVATICFLIFFILQEPFMDKLRIVSTMEMLSMCLLTVHLSVASITSGDLTSTQSAGSMTDDMVSAMTEVSTGAVNQQLGTSWLCAVCVLLLNAFAITLLVLIFLATNPRARKWMLGCTAPRWTKGRLFGLDDMLAGAVESGLHQVADAVATEDEAKNLEAASVGTVDTSVEMTETKQRASTRSMNPVADPVEDDEEAAAAAESSSARRSNGASTSMPRRMAARADCSDSDDEQQQPSAASSAPPPPRVRSTTQPPAAKPALSARDRMRMAANASKSSTAFAKAAPPADAGSLTKQHVAAGWVQYKDASGRVYFHNVGSGKTSWRLPRLEDD